MNDSKQLAINFLEKEIKTYKALSLFLTKKGIKEHLRVGESRALIGPSFYRDRMEEATNLVSELRKAN